MVIFLLSCSGPDKGNESEPPATTDDSTPADDSSGGTELAGECANGTRIGGIEVTHTSTDFALVYAEVLDAPLPTSELTLLEEKDGCRMMRKENPYCDPACSPGFTCSLDGECVPYPLRVEIGTLDITGTTTPISLKPAGDTTYWDPEAKLPLFQPGVPITASTTGSAKVPALTLHGEGVAEMVLEKKSWLLRADTPLEIHWAPSDEDEGTVYITLAIDQHGATPVTLYCESEDSGFRTVPSSMVDTLISYGVSGFPAAYVYRRTIDSATTPLGCVDFLVDVQEEPFLAVEGHTPCFSDLNCPKEQHCDLPTQTCVDD